LLDIKKLATVGLFFSMHFSESAADRQDNGIMMKTVIKYS